MRRASRTDSNQREIVSALREVGASVEVISMIGQGVPDLLVGIAGRNVLLEVKDGAKSASRRQLTPAESEWCTAWRGQVAIVTSIAEALQVVGL